MSAPGNERQDARAISVAQLRLQSEGVFDAPYSPADSSRILNFRLAAIVEVLELADKATLAYAAKNGPLIAEMEQLGRALDRFDFGEVAAAVQGYVDRMGES